MLACLLWVAEDGLAGGVEVTKEYQLKAAFLYNFAKFVEWPPERFTAPDSPIIIAVFGRNPFGSELEKITKERRIHGRSILVRHVQTAPAAGTAHVVFVTADEDTRLGELFEALKGASVLTVGESEKFARTSGMIRFTQEEDKLRFEINFDSAERAGLKISSHLLNLAKIIRRKR